MKEPNLNPPKESREIPERDEMEEGKNAEVEKMSEETVDQLLGRIYTGNFKDGFIYIQQQVHQSANDKGWWADYERLLQSLDGDDSLDTCVKDSFIKSWQLSKIALMHSELSECVEGIREKAPTPDKHCPEFSQQEIESADVIIRLMDTAEKFNWRLAEAIIAKMKYNATRPYKHGKTC